MSQMAGTTPPQKFVAEWLHQWEVPLVVNGFAAPARPGIRPALIDFWLVASGCPAGAPIVGPGACPLDLKRAPGSAIAQVRTNEIVFGPDWKLRESTLQQVGLGPNAALLLPDTTKQTLDVRPVNITPHQRPAREAGLRRVNR
jgi:hypothetical protein